LRDAGDQQLQNLAEQPLSSKGVERGAFWQAIAFRLAAP